MHTGIPQIASIQGSATNTSVTLQVELPDNIQLSDTYFNVGFTLSNKCDQCEYNLYINCYAKALVGDYTCFKHKYRLLIVYRFPILVWLSGHQLLNC